MSIDLNDRNSACVVLAERVALVTSRALCSLKAGIRRGNGMTRVTSDGLTDKRQAAGERFTLDCCEYSLDETCVRDWCCDGYGILW